MLIKKPTRRSMRILTSSLQKSTTLLTSLEERMLMLLVTNRWRMMQGRCQWANSKQKAWLEHYQRLLNVEFDWDPDHLSDDPPVEGPPIPITTDMVKKAISQMKAGKAPGPSGIMMEMIRAAIDMGASMICDLAAAIIRDGKVPSDWEQSFIVCLYKVRGMHWKGATTTVSSWHSRLWKSWRGLWLASSDIWCQSTIPSLASSQAEAQQTQAAAREVSSCQQETLHGFCRPGEGVWSSASEGHLVGAEKTGCGGVDCATGAGDVCQWVELRPCWWRVQWRVWSEVSPRLSTQPAALHHCAWSLVMRVLLWGPLGGRLCWWPCYHRWIAWGMCQEALDLERSNRGERTESKYRKDKD